MRLHSIRSGLALLLAITSYTQADNYQLDLSQGLEFSQKSFNASSDLRLSYKSVTLSHRTNIFQLDHPFNRYVYQNYDRSKITMVTEISSIAWQNDWGKIRAGRDFLKFGPTIYHGPLFSSYSPSLNHVSASIELPQHIKFDYILVRLDDRQSDQGVYKRWIYARRLQIDLGNRFSVGLKDVVLASGIQRGIDLNYLNPTAIYQLEQLHGSVESGSRGANNDNQLMGIDINYAHNEKNRFYVDFILDEFQIDLDDRKFLQDSFGFVLGHEYSSADKSRISTEFWLASPWLYTNGGEYTNVEYNGMSLGLLAPNSYGLTIDLERKPLHLSYSIYQTGDQTVTSKWNPVNNFIPLFQKQAIWEHQIDLSVHTARIPLLQSVRITYNLLNAHGFHFMATLKPIRGLYYN